MVGWSALGVGDDVGVHQAYTIEDLVVESSIESEIMKKILHSLSCVKHNILLKEPKSKVVKAGDIFSFNSKFKYEWP